ncbi:MAG: hypothetical protein ACXABY_16645 [Candidatus Thorarchaeota archaeon]|jgi:hypothetical protein
MSFENNPIKQMLRLALTTCADHYQFYHGASIRSELPDVKALLLILAETEGELIDRIREMLVTGVVGALDEISVLDEMPVPDQTPFDLTRDDTDPRIFICNRALRTELKSYTFFLSIAARAKSEVISRLFEYFTFIKVTQIERIRRVCDTF